MDKIETIGVLFRLRRNFKEIPGITANFEYREAIDASKTGDRALKVMTSDREDLMYLHIQEEKGRPKLVIRKPKELSDSATDHMSRLSSFTVRQLEAVIEKEVRFNWGVETNLDDIDLLKVRADLKEYKEGEGETSMKDIKWLKDEYTKLGKTPIPFDVTPRVQMQFTKMYSDIGDLINQVELGEPKKPKPIVVKQFVADWFEKNRDDLESGIHMLGVACGKGIDNEITNWHNDSKNNSTETLIIMQDKFGGYTVEVEEMTLQINRNGKTILDEVITQSNFGSIYDMLVYEKGGI